MTTIENPVINSPFEEPQQHFRFDDDGITDEIVNRRRKSSYFTPIPKPKKQGGQQLALFENEWTKEREQENELINQIRSRIELWRKQKYPYITSTTRRLLDYWQNAEREKKLFFCQVEALETAIYLTEAARKSGDQWIENQLNAASDEANPGIFRVAFKMATGTGKTVVMAMLIAWQALNKLANPRDKRFTDAFLIVTPGITIRDRLRVLLPNDVDNYYRQRDILSSRDIERLQQASIVITNYHAFLLRETVSAGRLTKEILTGDKDKSPFTETPAQMVRRVCREFGNKQGIIVINDEAHHCYRRKADGERVRLKGSERREAEKRDEWARVWISGIEAVNKKLGVKVVYDLSATPFFLRGSGYREGTLFPWVISDFSLIDAIESGIVKIPRVPIADDAMTGDFPTYRNLWVRIRDDLPKKKRSRKDMSAEPRLPVELEGALKSLYANYEKAYGLWEEQQNNLNGTEFLDSTPPVMIVVCNNTMVSKMVFDWIAGWEKPLSEDSSVIVPGKLHIFRNEVDGRWLPRPNTILVDSEQLESGDTMTADFKEVAAREIETFKDEYRQRYPDRDASKITDEDLLREVMNTVGKAGRLGEQIKCVVSVSMLTEGWDANTVTHILGVRAFSTQLICEQVVGRGLRRINYIPEDDGMFEPEYAEIYGVPFSFIPTAASSSTPKPVKVPKRIRALPERAFAEITFPRVIGYRYEIKDGKLEYKFTGDTHMVVSTEELPSQTETSSVFGDSEIHTLDLSDVRVQQVAFRLAKLVLDYGFQDDEGNRKHWYFPQLVEIAKQWMMHSVTFKDDAPLERLFLNGYAHDAADHIHRAIIGKSPDIETLKPILDPQEPVGTTASVDFDTRRPVYQTSPQKCHINFVPLDSYNWEAKVTEALENMDEVVYYVKNDGLNFYIPYTLEGTGHNYMPDYIARVETGEGIINLIIEVTGERFRAKVTKVDTARKLWLPAVNNHGGFGYWEFIEITDPWNTKNEIRNLLGKGMI